MGLDTRVPDDRGRLSDPAGTVRWRTLDARARRRRLERRRLGGAARWASSRRAAARAGRAERLALWAGQAAALARPIGAADLVSALVDETTIVLERRGAGRAHDHTRAGVTRAITGVIHLYFGGPCEGDTEELARGFHSTARRSSLNDGAVQEVTRDAWLAAVAGCRRRRRPGLRVRIGSSRFDVTDDAPATATAECSIHPSYFVGHLAFLKIPEHGCQIVAKAFRTEVMPAV